MPKMSSVSCMTVICVYDFPNVHTITQAEISTYELFCNYLGFFGHNGSAKIMVYRPCNDVFRPTFADKFEGRPCNDVFRPTFADKFVVTRLRISRASGTTENFSPTTSQSHGWSSVKGD